MRNSLINDQFPSTILLLKFLLLFTFLTLNAINWYKIRTCQILMDQLRFFFLKRWGRWEGWKSIKIRSVHTYASIIGSVLLIQFWPRSPPDFRCQENWFVCVGGILNSRLVRHLRKILMSVASRAREAHIAARLPVWQAARPSAADLFFCCYCRVLGQSEKRYR